MVAAAANLVAEGDVVGTAVMRQQRWELAPLHGILSTIGPAHIVQGPLGGPPRFPSWLGRNSTASKMWRVSRDLHAHMAPHLSAGRMQTLLYYLPLLEQALTRPLVEKGEVRARRGAA